MPNSKSPKLHSPRTVNHGRGSLRRVWQLHRFDPLSFLSHQRKKEGKIAVEGPELASDEEEEEEVREEAAEDAAEEDEEEGEEGGGEGGARPGAVVLHEDKKWYPSAVEVYGADVETLVEEEDAQPLTEPIVKPVLVKKFKVTNPAFPHLPPLVEGKSIPYSTSSLVR